jgi:hypothetical protein
MSFLFGSAEQMAQLYLDATRNIVGPPLPTVHYEELSEHELRNLMTYLYIALSRALQEEVDAEVAQIIGGWYLEVVLHLADACERFRDHLLNDRIVLPGGVDAHEQVKDLLLSGGSAN